MYNQFFTIKPRISEKKRRKQSCTPNIFSGMISERLIDIKPFIYKRACDQHFVQNMRVFRSNHVVYLKWHATPFAQHSKKWRLRTHSACEKTVRLLIPLNTDHPVFYNAFSRIVKCEPPKLLRALTLPFVT